MVYVLIDMAGELESTAYASLGMEEKLIEAVTEFRGVPIAQETVITLVHTFIEEHICFVR